MTTYSIQAPDGKTYQIEGPGGASDDEVRAAVLAQHPDATKPASFSRSKEEPGIIGKAAGAVGDFLSATGDAGATLASGAIAPVVAGALGAGQAVTNVGRRVVGLPVNQTAADTTESAASALTYQPRTKGGAEYVDAITKPLQLLAKGGDIAGQKTAELTGSPAAGAAVNTGIQMLPALVEPGLRAGGALKPTAAAGAGASTTTTAARAAGKAQAYAANIGLDWDKLSTAFKGKLTELAGSAKGFEGLKPEQIKRQALFSEVGVDNPSKGQVTRDPLQRSAEAAVKQTGAGKELSEADVEHNRILLANVENLRAKVAGDRIKAPGAAEDPTRPLSATRSQNRGDLPVGRSVQDKALRVKADKSEKNVDRLYNIARKTEPDATVPADSLYDLLQKNPHIQHLGWVDSWLRRAKVESASPESIAESVLGPSDTVAKPAPTRRGVTLNEMNDLGVEANGVIRGGGTDAHYAGQVKQAVDAAMEQVPEAAKAWKTAIGAARQHFQEFANQRAVRNLVEDVPHTSDRRMAIEHTASKTVTGKLEDLQKVKRSLLTGADPEARAAGKVAWRDLKGWGIDHIRERMTKGPKNEEGESHTTWVGLKSALDDIGDENLDELYGPTIRKQLRRYQEAAENLWTEPSKRVTGSPTFEKFLRLLDRIGGIPIIGKGADLTGGTLKGIAKVGEIGEGGRQVRAAQSTPIEDQLTSSRIAVKKRQNRETYRGGAAVTPAAEQQRQEP